MIKSGGLNRAFYALHCVTSGPFIFHVEFLDTDFTMAAPPVKTSIGCLEFGRQCNFDQVCDWGFV